MIFSLRRRDLLLSLAGSLAIRRTQAMPPPAFQSGIVTHFVQTAENMDHALDMIRDAGFTTIRDEVYWGLVEKERGKLVIPEHVYAFINGAARRGITPLLTLDYGNPLWDANDKPRSPEAVAAFARFAGTVATEFAGKVSDYEIWNEWHWRMGNTTPGSPEDYITLFNATRDALRIADPKARALADMVVIGDLNEALVTLIAARGFFRDLDGITVHPYFFNRGSERTPEAWARWMVQTDELIRRHNAGVSVPLYVTEVGWPSHLGRFGLSRQRQATMAIRLSLMARTLPFVPGIWWYDFRDDGTNTAHDEQNFGMVDHDFVAKPALYAARQVNHLLADARFLREIPAASPHVRALAFRLPSGEDLCAAWLTSDGNCQSIRIQGNEKGFLLAKDPGGDAPFTFEGVPRIGNGDGYAFVSLTERPVFLRGSLAGINLIETAGPEAAADKCPA